MSYKVEVKYDIRSSITGNVAIEVKCVLNSDADIWVYKLGEEYWYLSIRRLKYEIEQQGRFVYGGDWYSSYMKLVPIEDFKRYSKQLI